MRVLPLTIRSCQLLNFDYYAYRSFCNLSNIIDQYYDCSFALSADAIQKLSLELCYYMKAVYKLDDELMSIKEDHSWLYELMGLQQYDKQLAKMARILHSVILKSYTTAGSLCIEDIDEATFEILRMSKSEWYQTYNQVLPKLSKPFPDISGILFYIFSFIVPKTLFIKLALISEHSFDVLPRWTVFEQDSYIHVALRTLDHLDYCLYVFSFLAWIWHDHLYEWISECRDDILCTRQYLEVWVPYIQKSFNQKIGTIDDEHPCMIDIVDYDAEKGINNDELVSELWLKRLLEVYELPLKSDLSNTNFALAGNMLLQEHHRQSLFDHIGYDCIHRMHVALGGFLGDYNIAENIKNEILRYSKLLSQIGMQETLDDWWRLQQHADELVYRQIDIVAGLRRDDITNLQDKYGWVSEHVIRFCGQGYEYTGTSETSALMHNGLWHRKNSEKMKFACKTISMKSLELKETLIDRCQSSEFTEVHRVITEHSFAK